MAIKVIIPEEIKHNITQKQIDIVLKDLEDTPQYDKVIYACRYKGVDAFEVTWEGRPRYCGCPLFIMVYPSGKTEWLQDIDSWIALIDEARNQAPSVFPPFVRHSK